LGHGVSVKPKGRIKTLEELWEMEARHPFSAGNPLCQNAYVSQSLPRKSMTKTGKRIVVYRQKPAAN
jgi:hypothetical protein